MCECNRHEVANMKIFIKLVILINSCQHIYRYYLNHLQLVYRADMSEWAVISSRSVAIKGAP